MVINEIISDKCNCLVFYHLIDFYPSYLISYTTDVVLLIISKSIAHTIYIFTELEAWRCCFRTGHCYRDIRLDDNIALCGCRAIEIHTPPRYKSEPSIKFTITDVQYFGYIE